MAHIVVSIEIDRPPAEVWEEVCDITDHVHWMADATEIRFTSERTEGVGTTFECDTRIGPLSTTDVMEITTWVERERMGVRHTGVVTGEGEFRIAALPGDRSEFLWEEDLTFPLWMGGRLGEAVGRPVLRAVWRRNLTKLKQRIESNPRPDLQA